MFVLLCCFALYCVDWCLFDARLLCLVSLPFCYLLALLLLRLRLDFGLVSCCLLVGWVVVCGLRVD